MKELDVKPCANGKLCCASYDPSDNTITIFSNAGTAFGYINVEDIFDVKWHDSKLNKNNSYYYKTK